MAVAVRSRTWGWLRWPLAACILAWLIIPNVGQIRQLVSAGIAWRWISVAAALRTATMLLASVRWSLLLEGQGIHRPLPRIVRLFATGYVCNYLLPGVVGGDVARAGLIAVDSPEQRMRGAATVPLDRLLGLLAFVVTGAIAGICQWSQIPPGLLRKAVMLLVLVSAIGVIGLLMLLMFRRPLRSRQVRSVETDTDTNAASSPMTHSPGSEQRSTPAHELLYGIALLRESKRSVFAAFLIAIVGHACLSMAMYSCLRAYPAADVSAGAMSHLWLAPSAEVPAALLPLPGGVGAREGALSLLYGSLSTDSAQAAHYRKVGVVVAATFSTVSLGLAIVVAAILAVTGGWPTRREDQGV